MRILENLFGAHLANLQRGLSRAAERHSLLSENLANANTPNYKRRDVDFDIALEERLGEPVSRIAEWRQMRQRQVANRSSIRVDGSNVDLEKEIVSIAETELRYQALTDFTARYFANLKNVIREGR